MLSASGRELRLRIVRRRAEIPERYAQVRLADCTAPWQRAALAYAADLKARREEGKGLFLAGKAGVGKTTVACALLHAAIEQGYAVHFTTLAGLIHRKMTRLDKQRQERWQDIEGDERDYFERLAGWFPFLVIDDAGKEHATKSRFSEHEFDYIMRTRHGHMLPTIITTNLSLEQWAEAYGPSMASFIHEACYIVEAHGPDLRTHRGGE